MRINFGRRTKPASPPDSTPVKRKNALSGTFNFWRLLRFSAPTIAMMVFMSCYTVVDGIFVARFVGSTALSAVNITFPYINVVLAVGIMLASGGSAVIAYKMGRKKNEEARVNFTFIVLCGIGAGCILAAVGMLNLRPLIMFFGAKGGALYGYCRDYLFLMALFAPTMILQVLFQFLFVTAGHPVLGLVTTLIGGCANIFLDWLFIAVLKWGIGGAALATGIGYCIPGFFGLFYFYFNRGGSLYFVRPKWDTAVLLKSCGNGSSEMVTNLSQAVTTFAFNVLMLKYAGEDGVAAITVILYAEFLLVAVYLGYSSGIAPVISYNYGEKNYAQLKRILRISLAFIGASSTVMFLAALLGGRYIASAFSGTNAAVYALTVNGFSFVSFSYLAMGFNIFGSAFFTALSNGAVSALLSFLRTFAFLLGMLMLLPGLLGTNGIWLSMPVAEYCALSITVLCVKKYAKVYHYA